MRPGRLHPPPDKIAVLRANGLGDLMFSLPALDTLRATYPQAEIVLLAHQWHQDLLAGRPGPVDRVVVVPAGLLDGDGAGGGRDDSPPEPFFAAMAAERFDLAFQLHGGGRHSNPFVRHLGARLAVGLQTPDAAQLDRWVPYVYHQNEILRLLEVVALVGAGVVGLEPRLVVLASDREEAAGALAPTERPLAVLHPGATDPRRRWPPERFAAVADRLWNREHKSPWWAPRTRPTWLGESSPAAPESSTTSPAGSRSPAWPGCSSAAPWWSPTTPGRCTWPRRWGRPPWGSTGAAT